MIYVPREPTGDECNERSEIELGLFAIWYPQMGGYSAKAVVRTSVPRQEDGKAGYYGGCYDLWIWHDGEFPFSESNDEEGRVCNPAFLHHCLAEQFVRFGNELLEIQEKLRVRGATA